MSDRFLYQARPLVRQQFAEDLYSRINREPAKKISLFTSLAAQLRRPPLFASFLLMLALFAACAQKILTTDFHAADEVIGITIYETNYLLEELLPNNLDYTPAPASEVDLPPTPPIEESIESLSFVPDFPTWMPPGYDLELFTYHIDLPMNRCIQTFFWHQDGDKRSISMLVCEPSEYGGEEKVAPGKWEAITLNGVPALLTRGRWDWPPSTFPYPTPEPGERYVKVFWVDDGGYSLRWYDNGASYSLETYDDNVSEEDLIRIAESIIP